MDLLKLDPSSSYNLFVPSDVHFEQDGRVWSAWRDGEPLLLQLSSYVRKEGEQVPAAQRLADRCSKHLENWTVWENALHPDRTVDQATAEYEDATGCFWIHTYLVWPHLTVYVTISGPKDVVTNEANWALAAAKSIKLTKQ